MNSSDLKYEIKSASAQDILAHLAECSDNFIPHLKQRVNLISYSNKIFEKAITFEAWKNSQLIGLIAVYYNSSHYGFITNVSVAPEYNGKGIASGLLKNCIEYSIEKKCIELTLEVHQKNTAAVSFYKKNNFIESGINQDNMTMTLELNN